MRRCDRTVIRQAHNLDVCCDVDGRRCQTHDKNDGFRAAFLVISRQFCKPTSGGLHRWRRASRPLGQPDDAPAAPAARSHAGGPWWMFALTVWLTTGIAHAQTPAQPADDQKPRLEVDGHVMLDTGFQFKQNDPNYFDVLRTSVLPASENAFGKDGRFFSSVRQSPMGVRTFTPTALGELRTTFEFDLFGVGRGRGSDTTFHLRHAYGELGPFGAGQDREPVHGCRCVSEHARVLGAERGRRLPQRAGPLDADSRRHAIDLRARAPRGGSGDEGRLEYRIEVKNVQARFRCRIFPGIPRRRGLGLFRGCRNPPADPAGRLAG